VQIFWSHPIVVKIVVFRSVGWASVCVLRSMLSDYTLTQYRPSLLAYSVLQTITQLCQHHDHCLSGGEETTSSTATSVGLDPTDVKMCTIAVRNFLHSAGARLVYPAVGY